jgi:hypothetical protein
VLLATGLASPALAQLTDLPGPGGTRIAPGLPPQGYTPGGVGPGGIEVAPGPAARNVPMYRVGPGGVVLPLRPDRPSRTRRAAAPAASAGEALPQSLAVTIGSRDIAPAAPPPADKSIESIEGVFAALRGCWDPPAREQGKAGQQMSVRFSFRKSGELMGPPFVTYTSPGTKPETKRIYQDAIGAALKRCAPLSFTPGFAAAIAGKPISVRFVDDRNAPEGASAQ